MYFRLQGRKGFVAHRPLSPHLLGSVAAEAIHFAIIRVIPISQTLDSMRLDALCISVAGQAPARRSTVLLCTDSIPEVLLYFRIA